MPKSDPVFLDQDMEADDRAVVRVHHQTDQRTQLRSSVPAVTAMNQGVLTFLHSFGDLAGPFQNEKDVVVPFRISQRRVEFGILSLSCLQGLGIGLPHCMDIGDIQEIHLAIGVELLGLVPLAGYFVAKGCHLVPGIVDHTVNHPSTL